MSRALVLNASFEPLAVIPLRRAVVLVMSEKADVLESSGQWHSASSAVDCPTVIRLRQYVRIPYSSRVSLTRAALMLRDEHRCAYCGKRGDTIDHVIPRSRGGQHKWENVVVACGKCNHKKADKTLQELGWELKFTPKAPTSKSWLWVAVATRDPSWEPYLDKVQLVTS